MLRPARKSSTRMMVAVMAADIDLVPGVLSAG